MASKVNKFSHFTFLQLKNDEKLSTIIAKMSQID